MHFWSDNSTGVAPEIMDALVRANEGVATAYGTDEATGRLTGLFSELFETEVSVFPVATGTAANGLALSLLAPQYGLILCHHDSEVNVHSCASPEFYTGGAKTVALGGAAGRLDIAEVKAALDHFPKGYVHGPQPAALTVAEATEFGTVYDPSELAALGNIAREHELGFHMDGARFANAVASHGCAASEITWRVGVDVLSFGATKNGAMIAEAVVLFRPELADRLPYLRKRAGHLMSKMRFISAQLEAYVRDSLWLRNATHANAMSQRLADGLASIEGVELVYPVEANEIFVTIPEEAIVALQNAGFGFYRWARPHPNTIRLVTAFNTRQEDVEAFIEGVRHHLGDHTSKFGSPIG
jgi:threonine aldolase